jgi:hypothetical protein
MRKVCLLPEDEYAFLNLAVEEFMNNHEEDLDSILKRIKK